MHKINIPRINLGNQRSDAMYQILPKHKHPDYRQLISKKDDPVNDKSILLMEDSRGD